MPTPDLSVIIVAYNSAELTLACLASLPPLLGQCPNGAEVIVVDNASTDDTFARIRAEFPACKIIQNTENIGFGRANNLALAQASGAVILLLNSDATYHSGDFSAVSGFFSQHPKAALLGPRVIYPNGQPQPSHNAFPNFFTEVLRILGVARLLRSPRLRTFLARLPLGHTLTAYLRPFRPPAQNPHKVDWVAASAVFLPQRVLRAGFEFDPGFHMYFEDTDLCQRLTQAGWEIWHHPALTFTHLADHAPHRAHADRFENLAWQQGRLRYYARHHPHLTWLAVRGLLWFTALLKLLVVWQPSRRQRIAAALRFLTSPQS